MAMRVLTIVLSVMLGHSVQAVSGQASIDPDSLVRAFIERGTGSFFPSLLLKGCPSLEPWQNQTLNRLLAMELPEEREAELATSLSVMRDCRDPRVDAWFIRSLQSALENQHYLTLGNLLMGLQGYESPEVLDFARSKMYDEDLSPKLREEFGMLLIHSIESTQQRRIEVIRAVETRSLPYPVAISAVIRLLREDARGIIEDMVALAERDPGVVFQAAFDQLVLSARRYADEATLTAFQNRLESLSERSTLNPEQRNRFRESASDLWGVPSP